MSLVETEAIILRTYKLSEADKITVCLTRKAGLVRGVARGARRLKSRFGASLEPFTLVNLTYFEKEGRELVSLKQAEIVRSHFVWASEADALGVLGYMCELALEFAPPHEADERLFRMVRACLEAAAESPEMLPAVSVYYELWMLKIAGFLPELRKCGACGRSLLKEAGKVYATFEGVLRCKGCAGEGDQPFEPEVHTQMCLMQAKGPLDWAESFGRLKVSGRQRLSELTRRLLRRALEKDLRGHASVGPLASRVSDASLKAEPGVG